MTEDERDKDAPDKLTSYPDKKLILWVTAEAARNRRTISKEVEVLLEEARRQRERRAS